VNKGNYAVWTSGNLCDKKSNNPSIIKAVVNVSKTGDKQVVKAKISTLLHKTRLNMEIRASAILIIFIRKSKWRNAIRI
jgi:hypothetical protein